MRTVLSGLSTTAVVVLIFVGLVACGVAMYAIETVANTNAVQPLRRQNIDNDADRRIQVEQQYRQLYNDFQSIHERIPADKAAVARFKADHGDPAHYGFTEQQQFGQLENVLDGDYRAEIRLANDYNALATNADTGRFRPSDLPDSLTPDSSQ